MGRFTATTTSIVSRAFPRKIDSEVTDLRGGLLLQQVQLQLHLLIGAKMSLSARSSSESGELQTGKTSPSPRFQQPSTHTLSIAFPLDKV